MTSRLFPKPQVIITGAELNKVLSQVSLLDVRASLADPNYGRQQHATQRPSGSFFVDLEANLSTHKGNSPCGGGGRHPLPRTDDFILWLESVGIGRHPCVCFDDASNMFSGRLWWMLHSLGIETYLLDGGVHAFYNEIVDAPIDEGSQNVRTVAAEPFSPAGSSPFYKNRSEDGSWNKVVTIDEIDKMVSNSKNSSSFKKKLLTDARAPDRFGAKLRPALGAPDPISSHIPGAVNVPFGSSLTGLPMDKSTRLKPRAALEEKYKNLIKSYDIKDADSEIVMSCGSGVSTCLSIALMTNMGLGTPDLFPGSWSEYSKLRADVLIKNQIEEQGFSMQFEKTNPAAGDNQSVHFVTSKEGSGLSVVVDGVSYDNAAKAIEAVGNEDENFAKGLEQIRTGEVATIYTAKKNYKVEQK